MNETWFFDDVKAIDKTALEKAVHKQASLTKPPGSLGVLEQVAIAFSGWQNSLNPTVDHIQIAIFAADHGVAAEGVSAFPQAVTTEMIKNFSRGGAAICVLAKQIEADFEVVNLGTVTPCDDLPLVKNRALAPGTKNMANEAAMTKADCLSAMCAGKEQVSTSTKLFIGGEMGIGNTTAAAALVCALTGADAEEIVGRGTGIDNETLQLKRRVVEKALHRHIEESSSPLHCLQCVGGLEIAALVGAYIACAQQGIPVLVDGFISSAAALAAIKINPGSRQWMLFSHASNETGHRTLLDALDATPLVDLQMRLGEGSGAALVVPLIRSACSLQSHMATFEEAEVSRG